jgi:hypothetical protein
MIKAVMKSVLTAACLTVIASLPPVHAQDAGVTKVITNGPQVSPGDTSPSASARQNVIESKQYERLLQTNRAFREARMRKECGSISDPQLHQSCIASFGQ